MKLNKLLLLIPALVLAGCKGNLTPEEEVNPVSKDEFDAIFHDLSLFKNDNLNIVGYLDDELTLLTDVDDGNIKIEDIHEEDSYIEIVSNGFYVYEKKSSWEKFFVSNDDEDETLGGFLIEKILFLNFEYGTLTFNKETQQYEAKEINISLGKEFGNDKLLCQDVAIAFEDKKPSRISFSFYTTDDEPELRTYRAVYTYGGAVVTLPEVE